MYYNLHSFFNVPSKFNPIYLQVVFWVDISVPLPIHPQRDLIWIIILQATNSTETLHVKLRVKVNPFLSFGMNLVDIFNPITHVIHNAQPDLKVTRMEPLPPLAIK